VRYLDKTFSTPEENLASDEALLDLCEEGNTDELLRFWEPQQYFVVLGSSKRVKEEVNVKACEADGIPILRRHSGGGTVLQGPGCLNYSLILRINPEGPTRNVTEITHYVMQRHAEALTTLLGEKVEMRGSGDLTIAERKFSGNAQRRKLHALLFHGTFLLNFDLELIEKYLKIPPKQPEYRRRRSHLEFVRNIRLSSENIRERLRAEWLAKEELDVAPMKKIQELVQTKYSLRQWNEKL
jgi:lipoate-protein ligase A